MREGACLCVCAYFFSHSPVVFLKTHQRPAVASCTQDIATNTLRVSNSSLGGTRPHRSRVASSAKAAAGSDSGGSSNGGSSNGGVGVGVGGGVVGVGGSGFAGGKGSSCSSGGGGGGVGGARRSSFEVEKPSWVGGVGPPAGLRASDQPAAWERGLRLRVQVKAAAAFALASRGLPTGSAVLNGASKY